MAEPLLQIVLVLLTLGTVGLGRWLTRPRKHYIVGMDIGAEGWTAAITSYDRKTGTLTMERFVRGRVGALKED